MATCSKCGNELKPGAKFCMKCGTPVAAAPAAQAKSVGGDVCPQCGKALKPGAKFCMGCGAKLGQPAAQQPAQAEQKGWFTDGVRAVANVVTGGQLNRDIANEQRAAVNEQARADRGEIRTAQEAQHSAEEAQIRAEREAERARDRRNQEAIDGVDVVRGRAIWSIQPGEIARKIKETELEEIEKLKGIIVQEGCSALIFANGELVSHLSSGAYLFYKTVEEEKAALKAAIEKAEKELDEKESKALEEKRKAEPTFRELGVVGEIKRGFNWVGRLIFGEKKNEKKEKAEKRKIDYARILARLTQAPVMSVYLVSDRFVPMTFGGSVAQDGGISFAPYTIPAGIFDIQVGVSLEVKVSDIHTVATNYLADKTSLTTNDLFKLINGGIENQLRQALRNVDYQQTGLPAQTVEMLKMQIQQYVNMQLHGLECVRVLQITDSNAEFDRFRAVERELYCTEKELGYLQRTGEFRNRLAIETNKQAIDQASNDEDLRYALMQINKDGLLHDDEFEAFTLMLNAQKRLREAKSQEEEYEALVDLKKSRLVKDDEMAALEDALAQNKIQRDSITDIMRIQHQQSVDDARLKAEWAIGDQKQDHDWEREDLQRRRNWGIEDEQREREWMREEQEYNRTFGRRQQEDEYEWQKQIRENDHEWQQRVKQDEFEWQQRMREEQLRRENEQMDYDRRRQDKFDDADLLERKQRGAMDMMREMKEAELRELQEKNRSAENIHSMDAQVQMNRDNVEATMSAEAIAAKQISQLGGEGQVALAQALGSGKENELLKKQQEDQAALYQQMLQMQQQQGNQSQQMMMQMAQMMQQGMMGMGQNNMANQQMMYQQQQQFQQQRFEDQQQRANEYRQDAYRQQDRMDMNTQMAMGNMSQIGTAAASNLYTQNTNTNVNIQQPQGYQQMQQPQAAAPMGKVCPRCQTPVDAEDIFCGECGYDFRVM